MARRKGGKFWDGISRREWLFLFSAPEIMSELMLDIFGVLARSHEGDRAKNIARALGLDYRALNSAVGQAGLKIRARYEAEHGKSEKEPEAPEETEDSASVRAPWEYVFDGTEEADGTYLWILKPSARAAWQEREALAGKEREMLRGILAEDASAFRYEDSLFAKSPEKTVARIRDVLEEEEDFRRKSRKKNACCVVCGLERPSLLMAEPYGKRKRQRGLFFCPTHAALFRSHLISFSEDGTLLISNALTEEERVLLGLAENMKIKSDFRKKGMAEHRKEFEKI